MYERVTFGGLDSRREIPKSYKRLQRRHDATMDGHTFGQVLNHLGAKYGIEWRDLYYNEYSEDTPKDVEPAPVDHYRALVNPDWIGKSSDELPGDREDAVWHIPTKKYTRVGHEQVWKPLYEAIYRRGDANNVFGTARVRRQGGEVHMDVFFEDAGITDIEDTGEEITLGISTGHDYFGNTRLYVDVIAYHDTGDGVGQIMRYLVDPKRRKHTGEASEDVINWFDNAVARLEKVSDNMYGIVANAMTYEVPLADLPCSIAGFYEHLGLPNRGESALADPAGERAVRTAVGAYTAWHLYKAGMWAIEHHYGSRDTSSFKKHVSTVNTLLFNPNLAEKQVLSSVESDIDDGDTSSEVFDFIDEESEDSNVSETLKSVRTRAKSISEGVEEYEETKERLKKMLTDEGVMESETDEADAPEADA